RKSGIMGTLLALGTMTTALAQPVETVLHNFSASMPKGAQPIGALIRDAQGTLYGATESGGRYGNGAIYRVSPAGAIQTLHSFTGGADGSEPFAGVISDASGNLYGTTFLGGSLGKGVVFKLDPTGLETVLWSFTGGSDGGNPNSSLVLDTAGNLYGTTVYGGAENLGVVFKVDTSGNETVLHTFTSGKGGCDPSGALVMDPAGNLYGTTTYCGAPGFGVIFKLDPSGKETVLYAFTGKADGGNPNGALVRDSAGNLYGDTYVLLTLGTVFKLDASGHFTTLHRFSGNAESAPQAVILDAAGNVYGTTAGGNSAGFGTVFRIDTSGNFTTLYSFSGAINGSGPEGLVIDSTGALYGATFTGGRTYSSNNVGNGLIFTLSAAGQESTVASFPGPADGSEPDSGAVLDSGGNLYGVSSGGGLDNQGAVYEITAAGVLKLLHSFTGGADGGSPSGFLTLDSSGNIYGTASSGGSHGWGLVYKLDSTLHEKVLYNFTGGADGGGPVGGVIRDSAGNLYGTTSPDSNDLGVIFKVDTSGNETVLYAFTGGSNGDRPSGGLFRDSAGNVYGATEYGGSSDAGVVFQLTNAGQYNLLHEFSGGNDGGLPTAGVVSDSAGNLYGCTSSGGRTGNGTIFKLAGPNATFSTLFTFGGADGPDCQGVASDSAGSLYGAALGRLSGDGEVFKLDTAGNLTVLHSFRGGADGSRPLAGPTIDAAGNIYGTTALGGAYDSGVAYKVVP
ncbi:MAG TPA: choice-of-anchor tandem repeat GloVer-containing protein, partial [Bryobacteraceae bacterium]|nr:choice-of-anchor tandem repeat GloVer-containing protein [Bryobacteraceae bacterium]